MTPTPLVHCGDRTPVVGPPGQTPVDWTTGVTPTGLDHSHDRSYLAPAASDVAKPPYWAPMPPE